MKKLKQMFGNTCHAMKKAFMMLTISGSLPLVAEATVRFPPATGPSTSDVWLGSAYTSASTEWVNTDLYNLYNSYVPTQQGYLHATVYDGWDAGTSRYYSILVVYSSVINSWIVRIINDARHPDVVIADHGTAPTSPNMPNYKILVVYENTNTSNNQIYIDEHEIIDPYNAANFTLTIPVTSNTVGSGTSTIANKEPHIDMAPEASAGIFPVNNLDRYVITWGENNSGWDVRIRYGTITAGLGGTTYTVDDGEDPDVAYVLEAGSYYAHVVYYDDVDDELMYAKWDVGSNSIFGSAQVLESSPSVNGQRIEAFNIDAGPSYTTWQVLAEVRVSSISEIHNYRYQAGTIYSTNYSTINVFNGSTTSLTNNPLNGVDGFSPAIAAGNGPSTLGIATNLGNETYTMGWFIDGREYFAISVNDNSLNDADDGYKRINTTGIPSGVVGGSMSCLALANGSNDGDKLASAWLTTSSGTDQIYGKVGNNFSFKPTMLELKRTGVGWIVYPNPATDQISLSGTGTVTYNLTDMAGRTLLTGEINTIGSVSISHLPQGMYLVQLNENGKTETVKIIKQ